MNELFPPMSSKPSKSRIIFLIPFWLWAFVLFPMFMPFVGLDLWDQWELSVWLEIAYHVANGIALFFFMFSYLKDEWFMLTTDVRHYLKHIALTAGLMLGAELVLLGTLFLCRFDITYLLENLPISEMSVSHTSLFLILLQPIIGTIVLSVFAPFSICILFYCLGFAPVCNKKPWLAYLCVVGLTLIPPIINILWRDEVVLSLCGFLVQLPIHLLACWSYQKTDNVWTPILSLSVTNLMLSIVLSILMLLKIV